jgi:hypothetical protein
VFAVLCVLAARGECRVTRKGGRRARRQELASNEKIGPQLRHHHAMHNNARTGVEYDNYLRATMERKRTTQEGTEGAERMRADEPAIGPHKYFCFLK